MPDPAQYHFDLPPELRPGTATIPEQWYPGVKDASIAASSSRIYDPITGVRAVVIHATAGGSSAGAVSVILSRSASFHWLVPDEDEAAHGELVWATCYESRAAWHVRNDKSHPAIWEGRTKVNHFSLGIEVVNRQINDEFSPWQVEATAQIVRYCWAKYPNLRHVVSHAMLDPQRRTDPGTRFDWERFRSLVLDARTEAVPALVASAPAPNRSELAESCCMDLDGRAADAA
jgi:N-acetylmuramoyl-L-alanine amidase